MVMQKPSPYLSFNLSFTPVIPNFFPSPAEGRVIKQLCGSTAGIHRHLRDRIHLSWEDSCCFRWHFFSVTVSLFFMAHNHQLCPLSISMTQGPHGSLSWVFLYDHTQKLLHAHVTYACALIRGKWSTETNLQTHDDSEYFSATGQRITHPVLLLPKKHLAKAIVHIRRYWWFPLAGINN